MESDSSSEYVPFRILELRIQSLTQTTVPHSLVRLKQHKTNIEQLQRDRKWAGLNSEQINSRRSIQQLKGHIAELDDLRKQVKPDERDKFDLKTERIKRSILDAIEEYGMVQSRINMLSHDQEEAAVFDELSTVSDQSVLIPREEAAAESWEELRHDLVELSELVGLLQSEIKEQGHVINKVEEEVDSAGDHVTLGETQLNQASRLRIMLPVGGAIVGGLLGGVIGGPIGALAGLKIGAIAAAAGGTAGALGGAFVALKGRRWFRRQPNDNIDTTEDKTETKKEQ